jgi:putative ATPase
VAEVRAAIKEAAEQQKFFQKKTIVFIDEIHRFNKSQQDAFLPHVEKGTFTLIGATTENPSFEINSALLSRSRVFVLKPLSEQDIQKIIQRALEHTKGFFSLGIRLDEDAREALMQASHGDARVCLNILELALSNAETTVGGGKQITLHAIEEASQKKALLYDKSGEEHYNVISALHKSIRGSDPQAAIYWLYRMLDAGEDPLFVARRLIRAAMEDIGNADPQALPLAVAAKEAYHFLGTPEGELALAQVAVYLATAPK